MKIKKLLVLSLVAALTVIMTGCLVEAPKAIYSPSSSFEVPDFSGRYKSDFLGQEGDDETIHVISRLDGSTNAFRMLNLSKDQKPEQVEAGDRQTLVMIPLNDNGLYIMQMQTEGEEEVGFMWASIADGKISIFVLDTMENKPNQDAVKDLLKKNGLESTEKEFSLTLTKYDSPDQVTAFFKGCSEKMLLTKFITLTPTGKK